MDTTKENPTSLTTTNEDSGEAKITTLTPKMQRFVQLYMTGQYTLTKLSQLLEVHPNTLSKWLKRKDVQEIITDMQIQIHKMVSTQLNVLTVSAVNKLGELINSPIDGVALQAVNSTLDRCGHKAKQEIKVDKTITTYEERLKNIIDQTIDITPEVTIHEVADEEES